MPGWPEFFFVDADTSGFELKPVLANLYNCEASNFVCSHSFEEDNVDCFKRRAIVRNVAGSSVNKLFALYPLWPDVNNELCLFGDFFGLICSFAEKLVLRCDHRD